MLLNEDVRVELREFAKPHPCFRQQIRIIPSVIRESIQIFRGFFQQALLRFERPRHLANFVKEFKQHRVGNLPDVGEMALRFCLRFAREIRLIAGGDDPAQQS